MDSLVRISGVETIRNTEEMVVYLTEELIPRAKSEILILEQQAGPAFYERYGDERLVRALGEAANRVKRIVIIHGAEVDLAQTGLSNLINEGKIKQIVLEEHPHVGFWVIDKRDVLYEEPGQYSPLSHGFTDVLFLASRLKIHFTRIERKTQAK